MAVTTIRGGRQISDGTIPYADIQNVTANTILGNNTGSAASIQEIALASSTLLGRAATGNITAITLGSGLSFSGTSIVLTSNTISGVALGSNLFSLTAGTGLSGTAYNGSAAQTWTLATAYGDSINPYGSKTANYVLAAPNGTAGVPTFRALVAADIPALSYVTSVALAAGTTGTDVNISGSPVTTSGTLTINIPSASDTARGLVTTGTQTFAGTKSFSSTFGTNVKAIVLEQNSGLVPGAGGIAMYSDSNNNLYITKSAAANAAIIAFTNTAIRTYTLQNASGTLAFLSDIPVSTGGTVTSVSGTGTVSGISLSGTVTTSGSLTLSGTLSVLPSNFATQTANTVLAGPTTGAAATPTFRSLVAADIPALSYVTSVALSLPAIFTVSGSPVTSSGTLSATLASQTANTFFAAPNGSAGSPSFRAIAAADIPALSYQAPLNGTGYVKMSGTTVSYVASIPNGDLANSSITVQGTAVSLGGSVNVINGTGFVKASGTTISYDNNTYALSSHTHSYFIGTTAVQTSSANQALTGITGITFVAEASDAASITTTISSTSTFFDFNLADDNNNDEWRWRFTPSGASVYNAMRLVAVSNTASNLIVSGTITGSQIIRSGGTASQFLKADGSVDSNTYLTGNQSISVTGDATGSGTTSIALTLATVNSNVGTFNNVTVNAKGLVTAASNVSYLTGNQSITVSGDASGSGTTAITLTLATVNSNVGTFNNVTVNAKGLVTAASNVSYLTSYTETDTLATVTARGASTTQQISFNKQDTINTTTPGTSATYGLHFGGQSTADSATGITFSAGQAAAGNANAGIYVQGSGSYGTRMYIATTDSYAQGAKTAVSINESGIVNFVRNRPTALGNTIWDAGNDGSGSGLDADLLDGNHASAFYLATNPNGYTSNTGTVTSVALSLPGIFSVSGSPVTTSGTLTATLASQTANTVFAAPNGSAGAPTFRALVAADIPALSYLTGNQTITLSGDVSGSGTTSIAVTIGAGKVTNAMLVNSSFFIGTTSISLGRASAAQTLTGVSIDGNAATASTASQLTVFDTRSAIQGPNTGDKRVRVDFLANSTDGLSDGGSYHGVLTFQQWTDASGGGTRQLGFTDSDNLWIRGSGSALTSYGSWKRFWHSADFTSTNVSNWNTAYGWGNHATAGYVTGGPYLPLSGGTLTGALTISNGADLNIRAATSSTDSGDLVFQDGAGAELHRLWNGTNTLNYRTNAGTTYQLIHTGNDTEFVRTRSTVVNTNSSDFNTFTSAGTYQVSGNGTWTGSSNGPTSAYQYGQLVVTVNGNIVTQFYYSHSTNGHWIRSKFNASDWYGWQKVLTDINLSGVYIPVTANTNATGWISFSASTQGTAIIKSIQQDSSAGYYLYQGVTGSTEVFRVERTGTIVTSGSVGIGVSPGHKLDILGRARFRSDGSESAGVWMTNSSGTNDVFVGLGSTASTDPWGVYSAGAWRLTVANGGKTTIYSDDDAPLRVQGSNTWTGIQFTDSGGQDFIWVWGATGTFSIGGGGSTVSGKKLHIHGGVTIGSGLSASSVSTNGLGVEGNITSAGDIIAYGTPSDANLKIIKGSVENALEGVKKLNGYRFDWKNPDDLVGIKEDIGVIAQEVASVFPELARTNANGNMSVRYQGLTAVLIEAVKEQQSQIESLKKQIEYLVENSK